MTGRCVILNILRCENGEEAFPQAAGNTILRENVVEMKIVCFRQKAEGLSQAA